MDMVKETDALGEVSTPPSGDAAEQISFAIAKAMQQSVRTHIKANGFREKGLTLAGFVGRRPLQKDGMCLSIELKIEKVSCD